MTTKREDKDGAFGPALRALKAGKSVTRDAWTSNGVFLNVTDAPAHHQIMMRSTSGWSRVWQPCEADLLADDWRLHE